MIDKLSPELRMHLRAPKAREVSPTAAGAPEPKVERIELLLEFNGDIADLIAVGFQPRSVLTHPDEGYTIATGVLPVDRLTDLAAIDHVVEIEGRQKYSQHLNYSLPTMHGDAVHTGTPSRTGRNVVVGIVDSGVDWRHRALVDPSTGNSRIIEIWDQFLDADVGETVGPTVESDALGVIYDQDEITRALKGGGKVRARDGSPHGTHVAGIAAGNGPPASCCRRPEVYVGVAPEAELIVVRLWNDDREMGENVRLADAIKYVFDHPKVKGTPPAVPARPVVMNISMGQNRGAHDGTALVERAINAAVATRGRAVVVSAGNHADEHCHVTASVPKRTAAGPGELEFEFTMPEGRDEEAWLDLWYERARRLHIEVTAPSGAASGTRQQGNPIFDFVANPADLAGAQSSVYLTSRINNPHSRDNNWRINIDTPAHGNLPHGTWKIKLTNPGAAAVRFHCWIERGEPRPEFLHPVEPPDEKLRSSPDSTVSIPGTAAGAITVANHSNKTDCCDCHPLGGLRASSGRGPVARGADRNKKPDITAPGLRITSAKADARNFPGRCCSCCPDACCFLYEDKSGTSMAAPHVTGTIALMLEENPRLTKAEILTHLQKSATPPPAGQSPDWWGAGKLNAEEAIKQVRGGGGGGGGGGPHPHAPLDPADGAWSRARVHPAFRLLRARLLALPEGLELAAAVSRHFSEVRRLINTNRRVATMWHRAAGPCVLRRLLQGSIDPEAPATIAGEPDVEYLDRWCELLARYGSPRLRAGLERYRSVVIDLLRTPLAARGAAEVAVSA